MRPTATRQSALFHPLNHLLRTEGNVRVLRVLMLSDFPIGAGEISRQARLQRSGVARICTRLEDLGAIEAVGRGQRNRQYRRNSRFPLVDAVAALFEAERRQADAIMERLRQAAGSTSLVSSVWVEGPVAMGTDQPGDTLVVGALAPANQVPAARHDLWQALLPIQRDADVSIDSG